MRMMVVRIRFPEASHCSLKVPEVPDILASQQKETKIWPKPTLLNEHSLRFHGNAANPAPSVWPCDQLQHLLPTPTPRHQLCTHPASLGALQSNS